MKLAKLILLITLMLSPIAVVFISDYRYGLLQESVCKAPNIESTRYACNYPERNERERIVTTSFYRHIGDYFGRDIGTSPSWLDEAAREDYLLKQEIGDFNRSAAITMILSIIAASISGTLLTQQLLVMRRTKGTS